jgi:outer membrane lipoprotein SlyB
MHRTACCSVILMLSVAACSHPSGTTYGDTEVGQTIETAPGSVVSSRIVNVSGEPGFIGAGAGAAVGAAGGSLAVNGPAGLLVAIVGGLVGAGIGYIAEKQMSDRDGIEYVLEMDDGRLVTLVQNRDSDEEPLPDGSRVLVQLNGQYTRVMAHPAVDYNAGEGGWVDPDGADTAPVPGAASDSPGTAPAPGAGLGSTGTAPGPSAGPGAAETGGRHLLFQGRDVVEQPGEPGPPLTSPPTSGQQQ